VAARLLAAEPGSFALQLALGSFESRQAALESELAGILTLREREVVNITLAGPRYTKHSADFLSLSEVLRRLQKLYTSVVQAITVGPTRRGPVSTGVDLLSRLKLAEIFPSSFGMSVEVDTQPDMFGNSQSVAALEVLFALLTAPADRTELLGRLGDVGPRAGGHYRKLVQSLIKSDTAASVMWSDPAGNGFDWAAEPAQLAALDATLATIRAEVSDNRTAYGMLWGASLLRNKFEFVTDPPEQLLTGRIAKDVREAVRIHFGKHCRIEYQQTEVTDNVSGDVRFSLVMTRVSGDDDDALPAATS
jgi:hypothetical protein